MASDIEWNHAARIVIDDILERNENGNLYPLTSIEIQILTDIKELLAPKDQTPQKEGIQPDKKNPEKPPKKDRKPEEPPKKEFRGLDQKDLT